MSYPVTSQRFVKQFLKTARARIGGCRRTSIVSKHRSAIFSRFHSPAPPPPLPPLSPPLLKPLRECTISGGGGREKGKPSVVQSRLVRESELVKGRRNYYTNQDDEDKERGWLAGEGRGGRESVPIDRTDPVFNTTTRAILRNGRATFGQYLRKDKSCSSLHLPKLESVYVCVWVYVCVHYRSSPLVAYFTLAVRYIAGAVLLAAYTRKL